MENAKALQTHHWSDGPSPHRIRQNGRTILHQRCALCGRDFAQGLDGAGWQAVHAGVFTVELLAEAVNERWLAEDCPIRLTASDEEDRATRRT